MSKVLIVEDNLDLAKIYHDSIKNAGFAVFVALDAEEGLHLAHATKPDIILLDIMLPGKMNGFDLLEKLRVSENLSKIPVIVLTNLDAEIDVAKSIGVADYLIKANTTPKQVIEKVFKHLH